MSRSIQRFLRRPQSLISGFRVSRVNPVTSSERMVPGYAIAIVCMLMAAAAAQPLAADELSIPGIRAAMDRYARRIETLAGRQRLIYRNNPDKHGPGALVFQDSTVDIDFKVDLLHRRTSFVKSRTWYFREISDAPFGVEEVETYDGENAYRLERTTSRWPIPSTLPRNRPYRLSIHRTGPTAGFPAIWRLAGLQSQPPESLATILSSSEDARITDWRIVDDHESVEISATGKPWRMEASLDPNAAWLPRRFAMFGLSSTASTPTLFFEQLLTEFRQFPNGESDELIWFPVRGRDTHSTTIVDLELSDLRINVPMTKDEFQIDPATLPDGVQLETPTGTTYTGDRKDLWEEIEKVMNDDTKQIEMQLEKWRGPVSESEPLPPAAVELGPGTTLISTMIGVLLALMVVGIRIAWKRP